MKIKSDIGKVFRRIADKQIFGNEIVLGYNYVLHGQILPKAYLELPEHYEQIDEPVTEETVILDEDIDTILEDVGETQPEPKRVTLRDYLELEDKVNKLMEHIKWQD